jgi:WD40 repeat protein/Tfp pilus assembly protein PilF
MSVAFGPDGKTLATASDGGDNQLKLWDLSVEPSRVRFDAHGGDSVAIAPDGKLLAAGRWNSVTLYELATGKQRATLPGHRGLVRSVAFSADGKMLASGGDDRTVRLWDVATGREQGQRPHAAVVNSAAFSPDGRALACGCRDGTVRFWDAGEEPARDTLQHPGTLTCLAFIADGKTLISGGGWPTKRWDVTTGKEQAALPEPSGTAAVSADGRTLASVEGRTVKLWNLATGQQRAALQRTDDISRIALSADGGTVAAWQGPGSLTLWEAATQQARQIAPSYAEDGFVSAAFSPDGKTLAIGNVSGGIRLLDISTSKDRLRFSQGGSRLAIECLAFSPDSKTLAAGNMAGTVGLWDVENGRLRASLKAHTALIRSVAFTPDGKTVATGSDDDTVKLWDVATGQEQLALKGHKGGVHHLIFAPRGSTLATAGGDGTVRLWRAATDSEARAPQTELDPDAADNPAACNNWAGRLVALGRHEEAVEVYRKARSRLEKLAARFPGEPEYREQLQACHDGISQALLRAGRAEEAVEAGQQAVALAEQLLAASDSADHGLNLGEALMNLCQVYGELAQWDKAAADLAQALGLKPDDPLIRYRLALTRLGARDLAGYRSACAALLEHFGQLEHLGEADLPDMARWALVLAPGAVNDLGRPVQMAEPALRSDPKTGWDSTILGAALYRAGRFAEAVQRLTEASAACDQAASKPIVYSPAYTWFFLAMAHQRLGHAEEARRWLDKGIKGMEQETQNNSLPWNRRLTLQLFRLEAEGMIVGRQLATDQ